MGHLLFYLILKQSHCVAQVGLRLTDSHSSASLVVGLPVHATEGSWMPFLLSLIPLAKILLVSRSGLRGHIRE